MYIKKWLQCCGEGPGGGGGGTLGISGWGCAAGTLEPLAFTRASFRWILLPYTRVNSANQSYPRVLQVTKNSPKRVLTLALDVSFRFSTPNPGRVAAGVVGYVLRHAKYVRFLIINCFILTSINTTDFRLNPDF